MDNERARQRSASAGKRAEELARRLNDLADGRPITEADVVEAKHHASEAAEQARHAREASAMRHREAASVHDRAARYHDKAVSRDTEHTGLHEAAAIAHREARDVDLRAAVADEDVLTSHEEAVDEP